jgi:NAD-dependent SIR2 family protein deacetylase
MEEVLCCKCDAKWDGEHTILDTDAYGEPMTYPACAKCYQEELEMAEFVRKMMEFRKR